jgi:hypothetical protein
MWISEDTMSDSQKESSSKSQDRVQQWRPRSPAMMAEAVGTGRMVEKVKREVVAIDFY